MKKNCLSQFKRCSEGGRNRQDLGIDETRLKAVRLVRSSLVSSRTAFKVSHVCPKLPDDDVKQKTVVEHSLQKCSWGQQACGCVENAGIAE